MFQGRLCLPKNGQKRIIVETGAGQRGVAAATSAALLGMECEIFMDEDTTQRQALNVFRIQLLGAKVHSVKNGTKTLKDVINKTMRQWTRRIDDTFYVVGPVMGPHPYPLVVRDFLQSVISREIKEQLFEKENILPSAVVACVGGGSNSIGVFIIL